CWPPACGVPACTLACGEARRSVGGAGVWLGLFAVFVRGIGAIVRHTAAAITIVLAVMLTPAIAVPLLPHSVADPVEKFSFLGGGLAIEQTVDRSDNVPLSPAGRLGRVPVHPAPALPGPAWAERRQGGVVLRAVRRVPRARRRESPTGRDSARAVGRRARGRGALGARPGLPARRRARLPEGGLVHGRLLPGSLRPRDAC